jgi:scyllo-inositol 2-dehydrogenase (NADP+)
MINVVVVGHGMASRYFHCPLIRRQPKLRLHGVVVRDPKARAEAVALWSTRGYNDLDEALSDPAIDLIVIATPHNTHADLTVRSLKAGKGCVVDKVMALTTAEADAMIAARDASGRMLSVFHNRRWDWDYLTVKAILAEGRIGRPLVFESSVCRHATPRGWRGKAAASGTVLHDWGAHLVDQALNLGLGPCLRLAAWITPAPWPGVDSGGHGRITLEFEDVLFQVETSRICRLDRPRWWVLGTGGGYVKYGIDPQEEALRAGKLNAAAELTGHQGRLRIEVDGHSVETPVATVRGSWDAYYANIVAHLDSGAPLAVTAEDGREVVRVLDAAVHSAQQHIMVEGPWGQA